VLLYLLCATSLKQIEVKLSNKRGALHFEALWCIVPQKQPDFSVTIAIFGPECPFGAFVVHRPAKMARFFCDDELK